MPSAVRHSRTRRSDEPTVEVTMDETAAPMPSIGADANDDMHVDEQAENEGEEEGDEEEDEEEDEDDIELEPFPPPGLKEISSLASWTVSTAKPGNGVAALRSPDTSHFWQSDGPQPHILNIHFFKLVSIVHMRIFLDFKNDESYTPTKIQFLAGMGVHDLQDFAEMCFEQPSGWIDVDFSNVGPIEPDEDEDGGEAAVKEIDWSRRPVLRAFLVQVKILDNHQNGKDTHLRAVQLFARDETQQPRKTSSKQALTSRTRTLNSASGRAAMKYVEPNNIKMASWMMEPDLR